MADITNAEAIRYSDEELRPMAEVLRNVYPVVSAILVKWRSGLDAVIGTSPTDMLQDGREDEGVSRLSAEDIKDFGLQLIAFEALMDAPGVREIISKLCVRGLRTQG